MPDTRPLPPRRPTMGDVASRAGVSLKSVSRVVNAEAHVSPALADRVRHAIAELGYRPDRRARDLAGGPSTGRLVGLVQEDAANPFFGLVYRGVEDATRELGILVVAASTDGDPVREAVVVEALVESRVAGLVVVVAEGSDELLRQEVAHGTPVVCVDRVLTDAPCDTVVSSNRESTRAAVEHLSRGGHRRVGFLGGDQRVWTARERLAGYQEALRAAGLDHDPALAVTGAGETGLAAEATRRLLALPRPPTAIFAAQDRITIGAVTALHDLGRQQDIALFGFDEIPFAEQLDPPVSVVAQDPYEMGHRAGRMLLERLSGRAPTQARRVVVTARLHHRESGDISPP